MPKYEYTCSQCDSHIVLTRHMPERNDPVTCTCGAEAKRIFSRPALICNPAHLSDANKFAFGRSETERLETMHAHDRAYEANWKDKDVPDRVTPSSAPKSLVETYHDLYPGAS